MISSQTCTKNVERYLTSSQRRKLTVSSWTWNHNQLQIRMKWLLNKNWLPIDITQICYLIHKQMDISFWVEFYFIFLASIITSFCFVYHGCFVTDFFPVLDSLLYWKFAQNFTIEVTQIFYHVMHSKWKFKVYDLTPLSMQKMLPMYLLKWRGFSFLDGLSNGK